MSKNNILYVKGMNMSESDDGKAGGDEWDDKKLNAAYDKALRIAGAEVAKQVAMSTNTPKDGNGGNSKPKKSKTGNNQWKAGMPCRAIYEEDGIEYEATLFRVLNDEECIVRFLGYENSEIVEISSLKPTLGDDERTRQIEQALLEKGEMNFSQTNSIIEHMEYSDRAGSLESIDRSLQKKKKSSKKKKNTNKHSSRNINGFELPEIPPMPNIEMLRNLGSMDIPMPPPPMAFTSIDRTNSEDEAISSMLLSWYMSGYYTGLYQGMKRAKQERRNM